MISSVSMASHNHEHDLSFVELHFVVDMQLVRIGRDDAQPNDLEHISTNIYCPAFQLFLPHSIFSISLKLDSTNKTI